MSRNDSDSEQSTEDSQSEEESEQVSDNNQWTESSQSDEQSEQNSNGDQSDDSEEEVYDYYTKPEAPYTLDRHLYEQWDQHKEQSRSTLEGKADHYYAYAPFGTFGVELIGGKERPVPVQGVPSIYDLWRTSTDIGQDYSMHLHPGNDEEGGSESDNKQNEEEQTGPPQFTPFQLQHLNSDLIQDVNFMYKLGQGDFGEVWRVEAIWKNSNEGWAVGPDGVAHRHIFPKREFALKIVQHDSLVNQDDLTETFRDILTLRGLRHHNICNICDVIGLPDSETGYPWAKILIFMELCDGSLNDFGEDFPLSEDLNRHWFAQIVLALEYLYRKGIVHRDIKEDNILFQFPTEVSHNEDVSTFEGQFLSLVFKLADFGVSQVFDDYIPPESKQLDTNGLYGVLIRQILLKPSVWDDLSLEFKNLLNRISPDKRPDYKFTKILNHPWLQMNKERRTAKYIYKKPVQVKHSKFPTELDLDESKDSDESDSNDELDQDYSEMLDTGSLYLGIPLNGQNLASSNKETVDEHGNQSSIISDSEETIPGDFDYELPDNLRDQGYGSVDKYIATDNSSEFSNTSDRPPRKPRTPKRPKYTTTSFTTFRRRRKHRKDRPTNKSKSGSPGD